MVTIPDPKLGPRKVDIDNMFNTERYRPSYTSKEEVLAGVLLSIALGHGIVSTSARRLTLPIVRSGRSARPPDRFPHHGAHLRHGRRVRRPLRSRAVLDRAHQQRASYLRLRSKPRPSEQMEQMLDAIAGAGLRGSRFGRRRTEPAERDRCAPEDFYSTTNHRTLVRHRRAVDRSAESADGRA